MTASIQLPRPVPGQRPALCVMVLGTSSGAGKSWVATALCAWYRARATRWRPSRRRT
jgi:adenosylcobyric acid synthase